MSPVAFKCLLNVVLLSILLTGCSLAPNPRADWESASPEYSAMPLERIRMGQILAWQPVHDGLLIELAAPRRKYYLTLAPTCYLALSSALSFEIDGASQAFIGVGDDVVVGYNRCRITAIVRSDLAFELRATIQKTEG